MAKTPSLDERTVTRESRVGGSVIATEAAESEDRSVFVRALADAGAVHSGC
ncbi:MAG: hypothetical protein JWL99_3172 [Streptomyces oryziradicis]|nr:hypothetical protein [Actinacidiphila oryziradicis]